MSAKIKAYRVPASLYWAQHWYPLPVGMIATAQLVITLGTISMEIGNAVVDLFRANVYAGFWAFPLMLISTLATFACVCTTRTQTKAMVALVLQIISLVVVLGIIGFSIAFIRSDFSLCLGLQCSRSMSTSYSSSTYHTLKEAFISCELFLAIAYGALSVSYFVLYAKCHNKISMIHPIIRPSSLQSTVGNKTLSNLSQTFRSSSISATNNNRSYINEQIRKKSSSTILDGDTEKVCPNCQHISAYIPQETVIKCPNCGYQSYLVELAQQN